MRHLNIQLTKQLLPFSKLVPAIEQAAIDYSNGNITSPNRLVTPIEGGVMLSMPASAPDIALTKLINICPENPSLGLKTINGQLIIWNVRTGLPEYFVDGPTLTARRTAAVSMLGVKLFSTKVSSFAIYGCGDQSSSHLEALSEIYPGSKVYIIGRNKERVSAFCEKHQSLSLDIRASTSVAADVDVVITTTTSSVPVYTEPARYGRLIIGVGVFEVHKAEIDPNVVRQSIVFVDDKDGALHEAGDIIQANIDWDKVYPITDAIRYGISKLNKSDKPVFFKSVGCAAWDLAACRVIKEEAANVI